MPIELKTFDTRLQGSREGAEVRHLDPHRAPYYLPIGDEIGIFEAAYKARLPVLLKGPTGCGKTRFVEHMAHHLASLPDGPNELITVACHEDLTGSDLVGRYLITADETVWVDGPLTQAVRRGAICYLDEIVEAHRKILKDLKPETLADLEHQLRATKQASLALQQLELSATKGTGRKFGLFVRQLWPPSRPFKIMKAWLELPDRSANLAAVYRPEARFVIVGHTHYPGIWRRAGRIIINTGSFVPYLPAHGVILESGRLEVRKVDRTHEAFTLGKAIEKWAIDRV